MITEGAGDGGMMTGYTIKNDVCQAATLTPQGLRNLNPSGWVGSLITDSQGGTYHVGYGNQTIQSSTHALFWVGGGPGVDLHPNDPNITTSAAYGVDGQYQCGTASWNACVWNRTAASFRKLPATGYTGLKAMAIDASLGGPEGLRTVGFGMPVNFSANKALLWKGLNSQPVNLHPSGAYAHSLALACSATIQAGYVQGVATNNRLHAAKWSGSAVSFLDINPSGFLESRVAAVRGQIIVGFGKPATTPARNQAILWTNNSAASTWVNLHARLPYPFTFWSSYAHDIDDQGNVVGFVESPDHSVYRPVIWLKVATP